MNNYYANGYNLVIKLAMEGEGPTYDPLGIAAGGVLGGALGTAGAIGFVGSNDQWGGLANANAWAHHALSKEQRAVSKDELMRSAPSTEAESARFKYLSGHSYKSTQREGLMDVLNRDFPMEIGGNIPEGREQAGWKGLRDIDNKVKDAYGGGTRKTLRSAVQHLDRNVLRYGGAAIGAGILGGAGVVAGAQHFGQDE